MTGDQMFVLWAGFLGSIAVAIGFISGAWATRISRGRKPCPRCNYPDKPYSINQDWADKWIKDN